MKSNMEALRPSRELDCLAVDDRDATTVQVARRVATPPELMPGEILGGKYRVGGAIGEGGMGIVVAAHEMGVERPVAIKLLHRAWAADREFSARFLREAQAMAKLTNEHVVRLLDVGELEGGQPFLVMEQLEGTDLSALVDTRGPLPPAEVADYILQACEALAEAHAVGIVHRDLKPSNIYLARGADGTPCIKVLDFGIAKMSADEGEAVQSLTTSRAFLGSPAYMSPEQLLSARDVGTQADIWSLGAIMHKLLAGRPPFIAQTMMQVCSLIITSPPKRIREIRPEVPPARGGDLAMPSPRGSRAVWRGRRACACAGSVRSYRVHRNVRSPEVGGATSTEAIEARCVWRGGCTSGGGSGRVSGIDARQAITGFPGRRVGCRRDGSVGAACRTVRAQGAGTSAGGRGDARCDASPFHIDVADRSLASRRSAACDGSSCFGRSPQSAALRIWGT